jgi:hypothetical protein
MQSLVYVFSGKLTNFASESTAMLKSKVTLYAIIASFFVLGVYEKKMGDVLDIPYSTNHLNQTTYMSISGDVLIFVAFGLFLLCSYALDKK